MKIFNDSQREQAINRIDKLVKAVEEYDNMKEQFTDVPHEVKGSVAFGIVPPSHEIFMEIMENRRKLYDIFR